MTVSNEDIGETEEGLEDGVAETSFWHDCGRGSCGLAKGVL